ncbi:MAG: hypothetical protein ABID38_02765 [Candidatus Diapherotrites archaeon]
MIAVDASTLILTAKTELLDLFLQSTKQAIISEEVEKEATKKESFDAILIRQRIKEKKISVKKAKGKKRVEKLAKDFKMHRGEAETLVLCLENNCRGIATDDYNAMKACTVLEIKYISTMAILINLVKKKKLNREEAMGKLDLLVKYGRYSKEIIDDAKNKIGGA